MSSNSPQPIPTEKPKESSIHTIQPTSSPTDFNLTPSQLSKLIDPKSIQDLKTLGGISQIAAALHTDLQNGLSTSAAESSSRSDVYGKNQLPVKPTKSLLGLMWTALQDKVLIILIIAAVVSLALGLYTTLGTPPKSYINSSGQRITEPQVDWVEGLAILIAVAIVTIVGSLNDYQKEKQFVKLNSKKEDRMIKLLRNSGEQTLVNISEVVVGDIAVLEPGEIVPVDGIFVDGYGIKCDESSVTGESDLIKKTKFSFESSSEEVDCFMISGSKVVEGYGTYLVISVGENSFYGKIMMSLRGENENTPLQSKLNHLAELIAKLGATAGVILFVALMIRFFVQLGTNPDRSPNDKAQAFIQVLIISVTIVVVAVPEGLPLAVTLALAFATRRMTKMNLLVRVLSSCETMANATVICTDKTGTLTQNKMTVVAGSIGVNLKFANLVEENEGRIPNDEPIDSSSLSSKSDPPKPIVNQPKITLNQSDTNRLDFSIDQTDLNETLNPKLTELLIQSIALNSTVFEDSNSNSLIGSKTEVALIELMKQQSWKDFNQVRKDEAVVQMIPFSSERKSMGVVIQLKESGSSTHQKKYRFLVKGASEVLSKLTKDYVLVSKEKAEDQEGMIEIKEFDEESRSNINRTIMCYATQSLRTIGLCYRDLNEDEWKEGMSYEDLMGDNQLTLLAIVAIEDPLRIGVKEAVKDCLGAGVGVKMVTGDNVLTAKSIATQCGIYTPGGIIMEGPVFRNLTEHERLSISHRLQVLARSSPEDKKILIETLRKLGEICAVTGDGTNDGPALKVSHVGFSMGITGTEVAKEASDIILMDDNFASIVDAIMWGRCVNDSVKKFLQFQLSVNITAVIITFITSVASDSENSILTAVQLLWVNLIMDTFAALALATDPASKSLLKRKPDHINSPLITIEMWKMILGQSVFQLIAILILNFKGREILKLDYQGDDQGRMIQDSNIHKTIVFNTFVFCQIFNQFNSRVLDRSWNVFRGLFRNVYFLVILLIMVGGQILIVEVGGAAFQVTRIGIKDWIICLIIGALSLPIGMIVKVLPTKPFQLGYDWLMNLKIFKPKEKGLEDGKEKMDGGEDGGQRGWNPAIDQVRDNLATFGQIRGGRVRSSSLVKKSRHSMMKEKGIHTGELMTMVPTLVVTSIGAGWHPYPSKQRSRTSSQRRRSDLADPNSIDPSVSDSNLWIQKVEIHPDTDPNDVSERLD
ncbi:uncharacterized protein MELLADRAFT_48992 [Melampsora larici-populina 98AG31]|uniref:Calcium-transporting ATPase n=1 Tax=Melampsora larici-populina (strain 98AG31 / pathotype 3-4-7) TaxID=747676 RepID=F4RRP5_MELLP|nr:uncharacterized protein MELLADRAFT_48992 [Melampsora larici-populina 98AG31]EGG04963.1 hypothetical protein MELLADRAFT_48992 [Melampsora larici-populina 98AG31]